MSAFDHGEAIEAIRAGDRDRFRDIVEYHQDEVRRFLSVRCRTVVEVEELVQSTFVSAYASLDSWNREGEFGAWLLGIARNHWRHLARSRVRNRSVSLEAVLETAAPQEVADDGLVERLRRCLQRLSDRQRELLMRRHGEGLGLDELADAYAISKAVLSTRLMRLRQSLRGCVEGSV